VTRRSFASTYEEEKTHWWHRARRRIIIEFIQNILDEPSNKRILDIGCGVGTLLSYLKTFGDAVGVDVSESAITEALKRDPELSVAVCDYPESPIPWGGQFDLVLILDVLEHIENDLKSLQALHDILSVDGHVLITVPAYPLLWSMHDEWHHHFRRYTKASLLKVVTEANLDVVMVTYFNTLLALPAMVIRILGKILRKAKPESDVKPVFQPLNAILNLSFGLEKHILRHLTLPCGMSIAVVARKR
jgi:2-polyprenyl-3-methyl-5-hydroxy-6-metoxy-1,4-benzoquinol methylase